MLPVSQLGADPGQEVYAGERGLKRFHRCPTSCGASRRSRGESRRRVQQADSEGVRFRRLLGDVAPLGPLQMATRSRIGRLHFRHRAAISEHGVQG